MNQSLVISARAVPLLVTAKPQSMTADAYLLYVLTRGGCCKREWLRHTNRSTGSGGEATGDASPTLLGQTRPRVSGGLRTQYNRQYVYLLGAARLTVGHLQKVYLWLAP